MYKNPYQYIFLVLSSISMCLGIHIIVTSLSLTKLSSYFQTVHTGLDTNPGWVNRFYRTTVWKNISFLFVDTFYTLHKVSASIKSPSDIHLSRSHIYLSRSNIGISKWDSISTTSLFEIGNNPSNWAHL